MQRLPLILGAAVTAYWILAFSVALGDVFGGVDDHSQWWNIAILRVPGLALGDAVFNAMPKWMDVGYATVLKWPFLSVLLTIAIGMGAGVFLMTAFGLAWMSRRRLGRVSSREIDLFQNRPNKSE